VTACGPSGLQYGDWLLLHRPVHRVEEPPPVLDALQVQNDRLRVGISSEELDQIRFAEIDLVAQIRPLGEERRARNQQE